jgi:hypothetical protein
MKGKISHSITLKFLRNVQDINILLLLVTWEIRQERNDKVFNRHEPSVLIVLAKIRSEALIWIAAGAKGLASLLARSIALVLAG